MSTCIHTHLFLQRVLSFLLDFSLQQTQQRLETQENSLPSHLYAIFPARPNIHCCSPAKNKFHHKFNIRLIVQ